MLTPAMYWIRKKILTDENQQPVAVQIEYTDWLVLERWLSRQAPSTQPTPEAPARPAPNLNELAGKVRLHEDPLAHQERMRGEWT